MRIVNKNSAALLIGLFAIVLLGGCIGAANHFETYSPQFVPNSASRFCVGTVIDSSDPQKRSGVPDGFDPSAELKTQLEAKLSASGLAGNPKAADVFVLIPTITDYDPGSAGVRWLVSGTGAGTTTLAMKCDVQQNGVNMGTIRIRRTVEAGGLYSVGQWKLIFGSVADGLVEALKQRIAQGH